MPTFNSIQEEISAMLAIPDEELDPEQKAELYAYLDDLGKMEAAKVDGFGQFIRLEEDRIESLKAESKRLSDKAKSVQKRIDYLKTRYRDTMQANGLKKVQGQIYSISVRRNERVSAPEDQQTLAKLWQSFPTYIKQKMEYSADKPVIKEALKGGLEIPGCQLVESFSLQVS